MARRTIVLDAQFVQIVPPQARAERIAGGFAFTEGPVWRLDQWPAWRRAGPAYERASAYPRLRTLADLRALVAARRPSDGSGAPY